MASKKGSKARPSEPSTSPGTPTPAPGPSASATGARRKGTKRGQKGDDRDMSVGQEQVPSGPAAVKLRGAFSTIWGLEFQGQNEPKGRQLIPNLVNPEEVQIPGKSTTTITSQIIRETNVTDTPWAITLDIRVADRKVIRAFCTCYVGQIAKCKHVAALYQGSYAYDFQSLVRRFLLKQI